MQPQQPRLDDDSTDSAPAIDELTRQVARNILTYMMNQLQRIHDAKKRIGILQYVAYSIGEAISAEINEQ